MNFEERHEALRQALERMRAEGKALNERMAKLASGVDRNWRDQERFRKALRTGLRIWLEGDKAA